MGYEYSQHHCGDEAAFQFDLRDEGAPEEEFNPGIAGRLPRKNVAAGALIRDERERLLFLAPTYKPMLEIPGGLAEPDESPLAACKRELREELGVQLQVGRLLVVDWMPTQGVWKDSIQFIFDGGALTTGQIRELRPAEDEVAALEFLYLPDAKHRLRPSMSRRLGLAVEALDGTAPVYAEFGRTSWT